MGNYVIRLTCSRIKERIATKGEQVLFMPAGWLGTLQNVSIYPKQGHVKKAVGYLMFEQETDGSYYTNGGQVQ